ncbi:MAG TPA: RimK family alpha-L-glutamate ligase [Anaeromyxobacter sp.]|nr:RimK family alpha-L-glutamate ligase [Anaeromyxobacter sp.]
MRRSIHIGVVTAWPEADWESKQLLAACARRCHTAVLDPAGLSACVGPRGLTVTADGLPLSVDAVILARGLGRGGDPDVQFELYRTLEEWGVLVVNRLGALLSAQDKFRTSSLLARAGVPTPPAVVAQSPDDAEAALEALGRGGEVVAKPVAGSLGDGVERVSADPAGRAAVRARAERDGAIYLQAYVAHPGRDLRAFVVGAEVRATVERQAPPGEWRTNVALGASSRGVACPGEVATAALGAARALALDYAGVDLVLGPDGPTVIEVNGNPSWQGIEEATGLDMADAIADHVLGRTLRRPLASAHAAPAWNGATNG